MSDDRLLFPALTVAPMQAMALAYTINVASLIQLFSNTKPIVLIFCIAYFSKIKLKTDENNTRAMLLCSFPVLNVQNFG